MEQINGEDYDVAAARHLNAAERHLGADASADEHASVGIGFALLAIDHRLQAIEFQLSQMPRG